MEDGFERRKVMERFLAYDLWLMACFMIDDTVYEPDSGRNYYELGLYFVSKVYNTY